MARGKRLTHWLIITAVLLGALSVCVRYYWAKPGSTPEEFARDSLEQLEEVHLFQGDAAGGLLYFAVKGNHPDTLATATLIVSVHDADTGEVHSVRLPWEWETECPGTVRCAEGCSDCDVAAVYGQHARPYRSRAGRHARLRGEADSHTGSLLGGHDDLAAGDASAGNAEEERSPERAATA